jgi:hypothetical protein
MRTSPYYKRASKRFLTGTRYHTPCDAVEAGAKTLLEWTQILEEERNQFLVIQEQSVMRRQQRKPVVRQVQSRL